jgi:hypothetical protein
MFRKRVTSGLVGWGVVALSGALAVMPDDAVGQLRLIPAVGLYVPMTDLGRVQNASGAADIAKKESTLGLGLSVELGDSQGTSYRLNGIYGTSSDVPVSRAGCTTCAARNTVAAVTASVVMRPLPTIILVRPYLQAGAGLKRYNFDEEDARAEGLDAFVNDQNKLTGQLGVGFELNIMVLRLFVELSDLISKVDVGGEGAEQEGNLQHDFFVTVGLPLGG